MARAKRDLGDLGPIRDALGWLEEWESDDRDRRGDDDDLVRALGKIRRRLDDALADAKKPNLDSLTIEEYAELEGITVWGAYKRFDRGQIPGATKDSTKRIHIPVDYADQAAA